MEDKPAKTVLNTNTQHLIVESDDGVLRIDQPATSIQLEPFNSLLTGNVANVPTGIFKNCPAEQGDSPLNTNALVQGAEKSSTDRGLWHGDNNGLSQPENPSSKGPATFRPFNSRYWIGEQIGNGGMGLVYLGWDLQLQRHVAIKIIREDRQGNEQYLLRFLREARIASRLRHPSILGIHDFDVDSSGSAYIVMDLITGKTMEQAIAETMDDEAKRQSMLTTFFQICQAMAYAHSKGVDAPEFLSVWTRSWPGKFSHPVASLGISRDTLLYLASFPGVSDRESRQACARRWPQYSRSCCTSTIRSGLSQSPRSVHSYCQRNLHL